MRLRARPRKVLAVVAASATVVVMAGCGSSDSSGSSETSKDTTFVFGASRLPTVLDGAYVYDNESQRVIYQIFDRLVNVAPGSAEIVPELASSWEASEDGLAYDFELREGVKFHDGTDLDAEAVCYNFDRLYNLEGPAQSLAEYWRIAFRGFATGEDGGPGDSRYESCEVTDDLNFTINLTEPYAPLVAALGSIGFGIASPTALEEYGYEVELSGDSMDFVGTFGTEHPVGTGPFKFASWDAGNKLTLERNDDYWGDPASIKTLIYVPIPDGQARRQALENGEIDGYDNVAPQDVAALTDGGYEIVERPPSNVGYLAMNQAYEPLNNPDVRKAIAHALDIDAMLNANFLEGAIRPTQFLPPSFEGFSEDVPTYDYDPDKARELLEGVTNKNLDIWYATEVSRPYMPDPKSIAETFKADLEEVGFTVTLTPRPWSPDFLSGLRSGEAPMYIVGLLPDMADAAQYANIFRSPERWGQLPESLYQHIAEAEMAPQEERPGLYEELNVELMEIMPGVPYVHAPTHLAFQPGTSGYEASPLFAESMATVQVQG